MIDVPVPATADVSTVTAILQDVGTRPTRTPARRPLLLDAPTVMGVESIEVEVLNIRVVVRTLPGEQFDVGRMMRARIADALRIEGIIVAPTVDTRGSERPAVSALRRIRPTTWALAAFFVVVLAVYLLVRPPPPAKTVVIPAQTLTPTPTPTPEPDAGAHQEADEDGQHEPDPDATSPSVTPSPSPTGTTSASVPTAPAPSPTSAAVSSASP